MLLTLTTTHKPASELGFLLHKNPNKIHTLDLNFGQAHVFYPEAGDERCTAALLLDIDPVGLVRKNGTGGDAFALEQYVNDRPYVASSFLSVALGQAYRTAMTGRSKDRQHLAEQALPFVVNIPVLTCRGGLSVLHKLFEPLGYEIEATRLPLDPQFEQWGESNYFDVTLKHTILLSSLLKHLYVLIPVLDHDKHYWIGQDELEKLLRQGEGWLDKHPEKEMIARRYLKNRRALSDQALLRLVDDSAIEDDDTEDESDGKGESTALSDVASGAQAAAVRPKEDVLEKKINLNQMRMEWVLNTLKQCGAKRIVDMGCGEGRLVSLIYRDREFAHVTGCDVSHRALELAQKRFNMERISEHQIQRIAFIQSALTYRDKRLSGFDAATVIEVIEHLEPERLEAFARVIFEFAKPQVVIVTTPNIEYNVLFETLAKGKLRHTDHRFEWTRAEFKTWAEMTAERFGYKVKFDGIGIADDTYGAPTQAAIFEKTQ